LWGAAVVLAVGAGTGAVAAASPGNGRQILSREQVDRDLGAEPSTAPATTASRPATPPAQGGPSRTLAVRGGAIVVQCDGDEATLLRWTPSSGFRADDANTGPAATVGIRFESDTAEDVTVTATCVNGTPSSAQTLGDDHGGSGKGPGGPAPTSTATGDDNGGDNGGDDGTHGGKGKGGSGKDGSDG
jgi:hypothetical protein